MSCFLVGAGFCRSIGGGVGVVGDRLIVGRGAPGTARTGGFLVNVRVYERFGPGGTIWNAQGCCGVTARHFSIPLSQYVTDEGIFEIITEKLKYCNYSKMGTSNEIESVRHI